MDELVVVMNDILNELRDINSKLDDIRGTGINSIDDICSKIDDVIGTGLYNSISDICDKLDSVESCIDLK